MKKIAFLVVALLMSVASHAQFEQGKAYVGASLTSLDLSYNGLQKGRLGLQGKAGYLLMDNLMATAQLSYEKQKDVPYQLSLGVGGRYYIEQNGLYLGLSLAYKHRPGFTSSVPALDMTDPENPKAYLVTSTSPNYNDLLPSIQIGYAFFVSRTVTIEPEIYYEQSFKNHSDYSGIGLRVGLGVYLFKDQTKN